MTGLSTNLIHRLPHLLWIPSSSFLPVTSQLTICTSGAWISQFAFSEIVSESVSVLYIQWRQRSKRGCVWEMFTIRSAFLGVGTSVASTYIMCIFMCITNIWTGIVIVCSMYVVQCTADCVNRLWLSQWLTTHIIELLYQGSCATGLKQPASQSVRERVSE